MVAGQTLICIYRCCGTTMMRRDGLHQVLQLILYRVVAGLAAAAAAATAQFGTFSLG